MSHPLRLYEAPEHEPFAWQGTNGGAALLVHGFPGTPVEVRAIGGWLHDAGWTAHAPLLPGFGRDIARMERVTQADWLAVISVLLHELMRSHERVLLVGNSMGAALALQTAAATPVDGLILCAPFWRISHSAIDAAYPLLQRLLPQVHLFRRANFDEPRTRELLRRFLADEEIDDPEQRPLIRELAFPTSVLGEVRLAGQRGYEAAPSVCAPALILQGSKDVLARPAMTRELAQRLPELAGYIEVRSDHEMAHIRHAHEAALRAPILTFAERVLHSPTH